MYKEKLDEIMYSVNNKAISTKILQHMDKIRNNDDEGQARRFVWELIQNAKDVAQDSVPLKIRMTLDSDRFVFAHNGKNFRLKNLLSLINQVSGKNAEDGTTGKFGTGFITTHQLSEMVKVRGVLEDFGYEPRNFEVLLDRSGRSDEEIIAAVDRAMDSVRGVDENSTADYRCDALNTEFEYVLATEYSRGIAETGVNDACCNLFYCMAFVPTIYEIELVDNIQDRHIVYTRSELYDAGNGISELEITENNIRHKVIISSDGEVQAAIEVKDGCVLAINEKSSRLFCDFPLIDNVLFPFPTVVNSSLFRVNEPRSCITLTDNPNSTDSELNKRLMKQAVMLYANLLEYLETVKAESLYNVVNTPPVFKRSDLSDDWIKENIIKPIARCVSTRKILPGRNGLFSAADTKLVLPKEKTPELIAELNGLLNQFSGYNVITADVDKWCAALASINCDGFTFVSIRDVLQFVQDKNDLNGLTALVLDDVNNWLRRLFDCAMKVNALKNEIYVGDFRIIPTQSGLLKPITEVFVEETEIDEYFKKVCDIVDSYIPSIHKLLLRQKLISKEYDINGIEGLCPYDTSQIGDHIRLGTKNDYTRYYNTAVSVVKLMGACCSDERVFNTYHRLVDNMPERYEPKLRLYFNVWDYSHKYLTIGVQKKLIDLASNLNSFEMLKKICDGENNAVDAVNCFHELWENYCQPYNFSAPVLAENADGSISLKNMKPNSEDFVINDGIDDRLREIYRRIVTDGPAIIDKRITIGQSMYIKSMDELRAASLIGNRVTAELKEGALFNKPKEFQAACSLLMRWINNNEKKAYNLFPAYASTEDRMQLMTPGQAAEMSEQLEKYTDLMKEYGCGSIEEFKRIIEDNRTKNQPSTQEENVEMYGDFGFDPAKNNLDDVLEKIGERGEELAVDLLQRQYGDSAEVILCNTEAEKQRGYDIIVKTGGTMIYYEVKTHTETSRYRNRLKFSRSQGMLLNNKNYRVLLIIIGRNWGISESVEFNDVFNKFEIGNFYRNDGYEIVVS